MRFILGLLGLCLISQVGLANSLSAEDKEALRKTQEVLNNPQLRQDYLSKASDGQKVGNKLNAVTKDPKQQNEIYNLSSEIFADMVKEAGGNEVKLMELLSNAQKNPKGFANSLKPEHRQKLKSLGHKIEKSDSRIPATH